MFTGAVQYYERGAEVDRAVNSGTLDVGLKPGMGAIEDAKFAQAVKFRGRQRWRRRPLRPTTSTKARSH